jgi:hypothetical protein
LPKKENRVRGRTAVNCGGRVEGAQEPEIVDCTGYTPEERLLIQQAELELTNAAQERDVKAAVATANEKRKRND